MSLGIKISQILGPPGVGKTLTAESVALATGKPLLYISVADVGLSPDKVEENLVQVFKLAASWEAIILLYESFLLNASCRFVSC